MDNSQPTVGQKVMDRGEERKGRGEGRKKSETWRAADKGERIIWRMEGGGREQAMFKLCQKMVSLFLLNVSKNPAFLKPIGKVFQTTGPY